MDEPDLRAEKKADLDRGSAELVQDHLGRCHKSVQPLPPPPHPTDTLKDSRRSLQASSSKPPSWLYVCGISAYPTGLALTFVHSLPCEIAIKLFV